MRRARPTDDRGHVTVLALGVVVIAFALVAAVANTSRVFLLDRSLAAAADGAAAAAARAVEPRVAGVGADGVRAAALSPARARGEVGLYVAEARLADRFPGFGYAVDVRGGTVTVTLRARGRLTLVGFLTGGRTDVPLRAAATARSAIAG